MASINESISEAMTLREPVRNQAKNFMLMRRRAVSTEAEVAKRSREACWLEDIP